MKYYVPLMLVHWTSIGFEDASGATGFLPVFESIQALRKCYPDGPYICIEPVRHIHGHDKQTQRHHREA
jgi:hypothetical protein